MVASLALQFYRYTDDGGKEKAVDHPLYFLLHDEPNPEMTSFIFRDTLMTHLLLWGNAYSQIIRNGKSEVVALYPLMPDRMKVDRDEQGYRWISSVGFKNDGWWRLSSLPVFLLKLYEYSYIMYNGLLYGGVR